MALVNEYLAFRHITDKEPCLREFTDSIALAMCAKVDGGEGGGIEAAARGARQAAMEAHVAGAHPGDLPQALFNGRARGFSATRGKGQCRRSLHRHAPGVCKPCSIGLDTGRVKPFWVFYPGSHGRQCYRQHLNAKLGM
jgi:hypothetical protein